MQNRNNPDPADQAVNRRSFLKISGLLAACAASGIGIHALCDESVHFKSDLYKVSKTRLGIGTLVSMTLIHQSRDQAEEAVGMAYREMDRLVAMMNRFDPATALWQLNENGVLKDAPEDLLQVIRSSLHYNRLSGGRFEMTVKPVVDLFMAKMGGDKKVLPSEQDIERLLPLIGSDKVEIKDRTIAFREKGMGITLDGIAKGYIVDKTAEVLDRYEISNYIITAGGEIRTHGTKADKTPWTVAIQDPRKEDRYPDVVHLQDGSISTSGNYEVFFDREKTFYHIIDPGTGHSPALTASVSVVARTNTAADALTKPVFVMAPQRGIEFINALPQCECLVVQKDGSVLKSGGWKSAKA
jgi:thiamine biosynthesis lipoprotein